MRRVCGAPGGLPGTPQLYRIAVYWQVVEDSPEITVLQLPKFKSEATGLIGTDGIEALAVYLIDHPDGRSPEAAMGSEGQREARRGADHLPVRRFDRGREEATAASRGSSEGSAIECPRRPVQRRQPSAQT